MMKKIIAVFASMMMAALMFINVKAPAEAAGYKAQLILESYEIPEDMVLGEETNIKVTFKNVDMYYPIINLTISYNSSDTTVIPASGYSNQVYVGTVRANTGVTVDIPCVITYSNNGYANISFSAEYMSDETRFNSSAYIVFPVEIDELPGVAVKSVNIPEATNLSVNSLVSASFTNTTGIDMYNAMMIVDGDIRGGETVVKIGSVGVNKSSYSEAYISFVSDGEKTLSLKLIYENQQGESFEEPIGEYKVIVAPAPSAENLAVPNNNTVDTPAGQINISYIFLAAAAGILLVIVIVFVINLIRKRR